jgi:predicted transcriptional regulator
LITNSTLRLGQLELAVLDYLWSNGECDVKSLHVAIGKARGILANTIQSTLERLFKKNLLSRTKIGHAYHYKSIVNRTQLITRRIDDLTSEIAHGQTNSVLAAFVEFTARIDDSSLEQLELLIAQHKKKEDSQ